MHIRPARMPDIPAIADLINSHAEQGRMLHRSAAYLYERVRNFSVCQDNGHIIGCCSLEPVWNDLAELKSLAIQQSCQGQGIGRALVSTAMQEARNLGVKRIFCLTREPGFFEKMGFAKLDKKKLPHKVWSDCVSCPSKDHCDEIALILHLEE